MTIFLQYHNTAAVCFFITVSKNGRVLFKMSYGQDSPSQYPQQHHPIRKTTLIQPDATVIFFKMSPTSIIKYSNHNIAFYAICPYLEGRKNDCTLNSKETFPSEPELNKMYQKKLWKRASKENQIVACETI